MKSFIFLFPFVFLTGCAQTLWVHSSKNESQFNADKAYCSNEATRNVRPQIASPVTPVYIAPNQYNTNCTSFGVSTNCTTTAQPNYIGQLQQQNAQNMAQAGSNIGTAFAQSAYFDNCLLSLGWSKQSVSQQQNQNITRLNNGYQKERGELIAKFIENTCKSNYLKSMFEKSPCNSSEISFSQLTDKERISPEHKAALIKYNDDRIEMFRGEASIIQNYILQPLREEYSKFRKIRHDKTISLSIELYNGEITWGDYNQRRKDDTNTFLQERSALLEKFKGQN